MSIRSKGRRKIIVDSQTYLWYVALDDESPYNILNIVSDDKSYILACPLQTEKEYIISKGRMFQAKKQMDDGTDIFFRFIFRKSSLRNSLNS